MRHVLYSRRPLTLVRCCGNAVTGISKHQLDITRLESEIASLRVELQAKNNTIAALLAGATSVAGEIVVPTIEEVATGDLMEQSLRRNRTCKFRIRSDQPFVLLPSPFQLEKHSVEIYGPGSITCNLKLTQNTALYLHNVRLIAHDSSRPVIDAHGGTVSLVDCIVEDGRDGVYLSGGAHLRDERTTYTNNKRGVFRGFRCKWTPKHSTFRHNIFHAVTLGESHDRVGQLQDAGVVFVGGRGDVVFQYNPVADHYGEVFKHGSVIVLTEEEATLNLVDPTW